MMNAQLLTVDDALVEMEAIIEETERRRLEALERLGQKLKSLLDGAQSARRCSGIEAQWDYCDAVMSDRDAAPQNDGANWYKPSSVDGQPIMKTAEAKDGRSAAFLNITEPTVTFAAWAVKEMALPTDADFWRLKLTPDGPVQRLISSAEQMPDQAEVFLQTAEQMAVEERRALDEAERRVKDLLKEGPVPLEALATEVFDAAADKGSGVIHGPIPLEGKNGVQPGFRQVSVTRIFPDPACGADIQNGSYIFEGPEVKSARQLRELRKAPEEDGWIEETLTKVLKEKDEYEFYYFYGELPLTAVGVLLPEVSSSESEANAHVWIAATVCNGEVVRLGETVVPGVIPYYLLKWKNFRHKVGDRWEDFWAGTGLTLKMKSLQRTMTVNWRSLDDNTQLSAVPQIVWWKGVVAPANGRHELVPGKHWYVQTRTYDEQAIKEVKNAIMTIDIPCRLAEIRENIPLTLQMIPHVTGLDDVVRGISPGDQVGTTQLQLNSASHLAKRVTFHWNQTFRQMIQGAVEYLRKIEGFALTPIVEVKPPPTQITRDVQASALVQALGLAKDPTYGQDPKALFDAWLQGNSFDPRQTALTPERAAELAEASTPPPDEKALAAVESARIRAEANVRAEEVSTEAKLVQTQTNAENAARDRQHDRTMLELKYRMELAKYAATKQIDVSAAAAELEAVELPRKGMEALMEPTAKKEKSGE